MSDASRHSLLYIPEVTYGVTPDTPALNTFRNTGTTLNLTKDTFQTEELRPDRQVTCFEHGAKQVGGDINIELSPGTFEDVLEAALGGTWTTDTPLVGTDQLTAGTVRRSYTIVRHFTDQQVGDEPYHTYTGCEFNGLDLTMGANAIVTGSVTVMGQDLAISGTGPTGHTVVDPTTTCPYDSFSGMLLENGVESTVITEITMSLVNGMDTKFVVGSDVTSQPSIGRSVLTGQLTAFFENSTLYKKFVNEIATSIELTLSGPTELKFILPNIKFTGANNDVSGEGPIQVVMPFQAIYDETSDSQIVIERTVI